MRAIALSLLLCTGVKAMEQQPTLQDATTADDIATKISAIIEQYDSTNKADDMQFQSLVVSYFKQESIEIERQINPHLSQKLRDSDSKIKDLIAQQDKDKLEAFMQNLIVESVEDAFKGQTDQFVQLKELADVRLKKARLTLAIAITTGVLGVVAAFCGAWFSHH